MSDITAFDYLLLPFYLLLIYKIAFYCRDKFYPAGHPYRVYFIPALTAKIAGAVFIGLIYHYYYGGGDTFNFFYHSQVINSTFTESPASWLRLLFHQADETNAIDAKAVSAMYWYDDSSSYTIACLGAVIGMLCFTKYLVINVIIAGITFVGMWLMFVAFAGQYPKLLKPVAIAILFMPGTIVWGSGLFKDSFCMFSIGCLIYSLYILVEKRQFKVSLVLLLILSLGLLFLIKVYILVALLPFLVLKIILVYKKRYAVDRPKKVLFYAGLALFSYGCYFLFQRIVQYLLPFTVENVLELIKRQKDYLLFVSMESDGSAYDLGDFDPTLGSVFSKFFPAVNVTLFRPYLWESHSVIQLFNSLESTGLMLLTIYLVIKRNIFTTIKNIFQDPNMIMCLFFTLIFAFIVGVSTYNFGSLSRYKIPCTPFYTLFLLVLLFKGRDAVIASVKEPEEVSIET